MTNYTILMLYPDYVAENYGQDTYLAWVEAEDVAEALLTAQAKACKDAEVPLDQQDDFYVLFACEGHHVDASVQP